MKGPTSDMVAICPGTFDPMHYGHLDVVRRAAQIFRHVVVAVYDAPVKGVLFSTGERIAMAQEATSGLPNVEVASYAGLTVDYAFTRGARTIIRGLRATSDFEFEFQLALMNRHLRSGIEALFLMTSIEHAHLSSSLVKEVAQLGGKLDGLVPPHVATALLKKWDRDQNDPTGLRARPDTSRAPRVAGRSIKEEER